MGENGRAVEVVVEMNRGGLLVEIMLGGGAENENIS